LFLFILSVLLLYSCFDLTEAPKTEEDILPALTQEGKGTFGFKINEAIWIPKGYKGESEAFYYPWSISKDLYGRLQIRANQNDNESAVVFRTTNVYGPGKYFVYQQSSEHKTLIYYERKVGFYYRYALDTNNFVIIDKLDTIARIVSGRFQFNVINDSNVFDTVKIVDGRFDMKYSY
ncbi:MAG: hypothetical protein JNM67_08295, partial [Bacteroidetes bacterium]|nr:hypothetical protein [Bacteroidota bacterium]